MRPERREHGLSPRRIFFAVCLSANVAGCPPLETPDLDPQPGGAHLIRLVHLSDPQIVDEESPARSVRTDDRIPPSWRPQEAFGVQTLDATLQRVNAIHREGRPVDFVLITGDLVDLAQHNELQWFMDTMDGNTVTADSGTLDGSERDVPDALNPKLPYAATGLDPEIPWYTCYGNHDGLAAGTFTINRETPPAVNWFAPLFPIVADAIGYHDLHPNWNFMLPTADLSPAVISGGGAPLLPGAAAIDRDALEAGPIAPDPARRFLSKRGFIAMHLASDTPPRGHGYTQASLVRSETWYSVRPVPEIPLRLVVFDTVASGPHYGLPLHYGSLSRAHMEEFILPELEAAAASGEWVVLASHHPSSDFAIPFPGETVSTHAFREVVARYSNVIVHLTGHAHRNRASIIPGEHPYLEIGTSSIIDYPQEGRVLDFILEDGGATIRVESRLFSHVEAPTTFSAESFRLAEIDFIARQARAKAREGEPIQQHHGDELNPRGDTQDRDFVVRLPK